MPRTKLKKQFQTPQQTPALSLVPSHSQPPATEPPNTTSPTTADPLGDDLNGFIDTLLNDLPEGPQKPKKSTISKKARKPKSTGKFASSPFRRANSETLNKEKYLNSLYRLDSREIPTITPRAGSAPHKVIGPKYLQRKLKEFELENKREIEQNARKQIKKINSKLHFTQYESKFLRNILEAI